MNRTEKALALHLAAAIAAAVAVAILQAIAGALVTRGLDVGDAELWSDLGLRRASIFKAGLFLALFPLALQAFGGEERRRVAAGFAISAALGWLGAAVVFGDRETGALFLLAGLAATLAGSFDGWRRLAAAEALGLVVAATALASSGTSLLEGRVFFSALVAGLLVTGRLRPRRGGAPGRGESRPRDQRSVIDAPDLTLPRPRRSPPPRGPRRDPWARPERGRRRSRAPELRRSARRATPAALGRRAASRGTGSGPRRGRPARAA